MTTTIRTTGILASDLQKGYVLLWEGQTREVVAVSLPDAHSATEKYMHVTLAGLDVTLVLRPDSTVIVQATDDEF